MCCYFFYFSTTFLFWDLKHCKYLTYLTAVHMCTHVHTHMCTAVKCLCSHIVRPGKGVNLRSSFSSLESYDTRNGVKAPKTLKWSRRCVNIELPLVPTLKIKRNNLHVPVWMLWVLVIVYSPASNKLHCVY